MALRKKVDLPSGVTVKYWRIESISSKVRKFDNTPESPEVTDCSIIVIAYVSEVLRDKGKASVTVKNFGFDIAIADFVAGYDALKTLPFFEGATDC